MSIDTQTFRQQLIEQLEQLGQASSTETALFHQLAAQQYDLGITDIKTLTLLLQEGQQTAGELKTALGMTTGAVTNLIDRLERRHLVTRSSDPKDRRKVIVTVNKQQARTTITAYASVASAFRHLHESLSDDQLSTLVNYYKEMLAIMQREIANLKSNEK